MVVFHRSAMIASGKLAEAVPWAHKIAGMWQEITGVEVDVMMPVGGSPFQIVWRGTYDSLASFEEAVGKTVSNPDYMAEITAGSDLFIEGSAEDWILQSF